MPSIRILRFAGLLPEVAPSLLAVDHAQIAHNTLLWDGMLRALPAWQSRGSSGAPIASIYASPSSSTQYAVDSDLASIQVSYQEPFDYDSLYGIYGGILQYKSGGAIYPTLPKPILTSISQVVTNVNQSVYPIPRTYAFTYMSGNRESAPTALPGVGEDGTVFEGDLVTISFVATNSNGYNITGGRLYRTVPGFDTGEELGNPRETKFHLVEEFNNFSSDGSYTYVDGALSANLPGDLLLTQQFNPPLVQSMSFLGQTEMGWLVAGGYGGGNKSQLQVSERFLWHAWPLQNYVEIPDQLVDATVFYDDIFIGTPNVPYHMRITFSDNVEIDGLEISTRPFPDKYACVPNTMVTTNFGAMYASPYGLVALEVNIDDVASKKLTNPGDSLLNPVTPIKIASAQSAAWWNGFYVGFCSSVGYLFNSENSHNNHFPLGQLITFDTPAGYPGVNYVVGGPSASSPGELGGLFAAWGNTLYNWPLPGFGYESASLLTYQWKSKRFTLPGGTTMAAAKVVRASAGTVQFNLYGDDNLIYSVSVPDSKPFRLPHNHNCIEWEIELIGTAAIEETHVSTSMRELTEETGHD